MKNPDDQKPQNMGVLWQAAAVIAIPLVIYAAAKIALDPHGTWLDRLMAPDGVAFPPVRPSGGRGAIFAYLASFPRPLTL